MRKILLALFCVIVCVSPGLCDVPIDESHFPDPVFREWLKGYDTFGGYDEYGYQKWPHWDEDPNTYSDGILSDIEIEKIGSFSYHWNDGEDDKRISTLEGIKYLTSINHIYVNYRGATDKYITELDVSGMKNLQFIDFIMEIETEDDYDSNQEYVFSYDVNIRVNAAGCTNLERITANGISELNLNGCSGLQELRCDGIHWYTKDWASLGDIPSLESLDLSGCNSLWYLWLYGTKITSLKSSGLQQFERCYRKLWLTEDIRP